MVVDAGTTAADLDIAVDTVGLLQESTTRQLHPTLFRTTASTESKAADVMVNPDSTVLDMLGAPINPSSGRMRSGSTAFTTDSSVIEQELALQAFISANGHDIIVVHQRLPQSMRSGELEALSGSAFRIHAGRIELLGTAGMAEAEPNVPDQLAFLTDDDPQTVSNVWTIRELFALGLFGALACGALVFLSRRILSHRQQ